MVIELVTNRAPAPVIAAHLLVCDRDFVPQLSERVEITDYAGKITDKAQRFEAWHEGELAGLVAAYCSDTSGGVAFISSVSVDPRWRGRKIARQLLETCIAHVRNLGFETVELEVGILNRNAVSLYQGLGFLAVDTKDASCRMCLTIKGMES